MFNSTKRDWFIYLFLIVITLAVYSRVTESKFVHYDDYIYVADNDHVKTGLTLDNVRWAFAGKYESNWMPLTWISFMADHEIGSQSYSMEYGNAENPVVYHVTNLVLHILNTILLFVVLSAFTGFRWRSLVVAAIFAVHPLHVESVAWVAERKDVLSTFFMMLALWAYLSYSRHRGVGRYLLVMVAFALGLMSKSMLVTLPVVFLLLDFWPLRRVSGWTGDKQLSGESWRNLVREKIPFFALSLAAAAVAVLAQDRGHSLGKLADYPLGVRLANAVVSYIAYIGKAIWPVNLACLYPHPKNTLPVLLVIGSGLLLAAITYCAVRAARRLPYVTVGWLWYVITLLPVIGIVQVGSQALADRYTYIPLTGLSIAVVWGACELAARRRAAIAALAVVTGVVLVCLMVRAQLQVGFWSDDFALFGHAIKITRNNAIAQYNMADSLIAEQKSDQAIPYLLEAIRIDPNKAEAHNNLGGLLLAGNDPQGALEHFRAAVRIRPSYGDAQSNLGLTLVQMGKVEEAIPHLQVAHRLKPDDEVIGTALRDAQDMCKQADSK